MARHLHHWLEMVEALLIIGILLAIAWVTWQALTQALGHLAGTHAGVLPGL